MTHPHFMSGFQTGMEHPRVDNSEIGPTIFPVAGVSNRAT